MVCPVGQTPQILWVITGASLGSLRIRMFSKPLNMVPDASARVIPEPTDAVIVHFECPSILVKGSMVIVGIFYTSFPKQN
jgi:hypothetical protein